MQVAGRMLQSGVALLRRRLGLVRTVALRAAMALSQRERICGIEVVDLTRDKDAGAVFGKVRDALCLISNADPRRLDRIRGDARRLAVAALGEAAGEWWQDLRAIAIDRRHAERQTTAAVAMTLVHEATHARIQRRGVRYRPGIRERVERVCVAQEIEFAMRVPGTEALIKGARLKLEKRWWEQHRSTGP